MVRPSIWLCCLALLLSSGCKNRPSKRAADEPKDPKRHSKVMSVDVGGTRPEVRPTPKPYLDRILPGDKYARNPMGGYRYNASREKRRRVHATLILAKIKKTLKNKTPEQLIGMLNSVKGLVLWNPIGVDYYVCRDKNKLIEGELRRRGEAARPTLLKFKNDKRSLFTGSAGPLYRVGDMCSRLLSKLDKAKATP